jgi:hypothetical protein
MVLITVNTLMKYTVVTTFNAEGYKTYGRRMIRTFLDAWPNTVELLVYAEDCAVPTQASNLQVIDLHTASSELVAFKQRYHLDPRANGQSPDPKRRDAHKPFKWHAIRFSHKVYSIMAAAKKTNADWLIWMDADMVCHTAITEQDLDRMLPADRDLCFLGRANKFSECGLYGMNLRSPATQDFLQKFQRMYDQAETGIFTLIEWHDSFVFDAVRKQCTLKELDWTGHMITGEGHPLVNCEWGRWLDHLKGARKTSGQSWAKDFKTPRSESYWRNIK